MPAYQMQRCGHDSDPLPPMHKAAAERTDGRIVLDLPEQRLRPALPGAIGVVDRTPLAEPTVIC